MRTHVATAVAVALVTLSTATAAAASGGQAAEDAGRDVEQSFANGVWYGRYVIDHIALQSGLGIEFDPPDSFLERVADDLAVDVAAAIPEGAVFLEAVFAGAEPGEDGGTEWTELVRNITPATQAMAILAEVQAAKLLDESAAAPGADPELAGAARLRGVLYLTEAKAQADFAIVNMMDASGLFFPVELLDGDLTIVPEAPMLTDQFLMLRALSELALVLEDDGVRSELYADPRFRAWFASGAADLYSLIEPAVPVLISEMAKGIQAFTAYASVVDHDATRAAVLERVDVLAAMLGEATPATTVERAHVVRGLTEYAAVTGDDTHDATIAALVDNVVTLFDPNVGTFTDLTILTAGDMGTVVGGLHAYRYLHPEAAQEAGVPGTLAAFIDGAVSSSGMMQAVPDPVSASVPLGADAAPEGDLSHPAVPRSELPPVLLEEVMMDPARGLWEVTNGYFDMATGMYAASELLLLDSTVSPFAPAVTRVAETEQTPPAPSEEEPEVIEVTEPDPTTAPTTPPTTEAASGLTVSVDEPEPAPTPAVTAPEPTGGSSMMPVVVFVTALIGALGAFAFGMVRFSRISSR